ncbi:hypothetical protein V6O07_16635, partial [Arthrospira platensis SPKY2]
DEETGIPEHRFGYPSHDIRRLSSNGPLAEAIGSQLAAPDETRTTRLADGGWTHFLPLRERGFCALVRARTPLEPEMQAALVPIFERLATACAACCEHEKTEALRAQAE